MRIAAIILVLLSTAPLAAQETCDVRSTVEDRGKTVVFQQKMFCGDGDPVLTLICTRGKKSIKASLPIGDVAKGKGEQQTVTMEIGGKSVKRRLTVTSQETSDLVLEPRDPLWQALSAVGTDIPVFTEDFSTSVSIVTDSAANFEEWQGLCQE